MNGRPRTASVGPSGVGSVDARPIAPDLISLELEDACATASWAGTRIMATSVTQGRGPWGIVVAQSPSPGMRMQTGWRIHVLVSVRPASNDRTDG